MLKQIFVQYENSLLQFHLLQHMTHLSVVYCTLLYSFEQFYEYLLFFVLANTTYVHNILCTVEMSYRGYMKDRNTLLIPVHLIPTLTLTLVNLSKDLRKSAIQSCREPMKCFKCNE